MKTYLRTFQFAKEFYPNLTLSIIFLIFFNLFNAISLTLVIPFLELLFSGKTTSIPTITDTDLGGWKDEFFHWLDSQIAEVGKFETLIWFCGIILVAIFLKSLFKYLSSYQLATFEHGLIRNIRNKIFEHLTKMGLSFYTNTPKGQLMNIAVTDVQILQEAVVGTVQNILSDPITMITFLVTMILISWKLTLFTLIVLPVTGLAISAIAKSLKRDAVRAQEQMDILMAQKDEFISGIRVVKAFTAENHALHQYLKRNDFFTKLMINFRRRSDLASPTTEVLSITVVIAIILYGGYLILAGKGELKASEFIGFIALFSQFIAPIKTLSGAVTRIQKGAASFERIERLLSTPIEQTEQILGKIAPPFSTAIEIKDVHFQYSNKQKHALSDISLSIQKGEIVALVGPSGGGKSTLADLIARFYDPQIGIITFDGIPYQEYDATSIREQMGIVTQEGILFHDTVHNNIAYGGRGYSREKVIEAAKVANAHAFIEQLPQGYDTVLGERGTKLSGGQRQRIAIARAILRNPAILILDEATSALDTESERLVQEALERVMKDRTSIVIAHRLSTILNASKIIVIEEGKVIEIGTHTSLVAQRGLYAKLYENQFSTI
ncbi:MAG: ABC transporter ATP-binding protein/permease [Bacteroidia bacterium]|nr:ABC transporter ATP-binding protein/permease [Bacteroidia bacterium]